MMFPSLIRSLTNRSRRWLAAASTAEAAPLVDAEGLRRLALLARSLPGSLIGFRRAAAHPLIGEIRSVQRGRGFEFEENRPYRPGDEPRLLNWRLYARSGELYTKVFTEERRPQAFLLVDRRAAMRFGTRRQLKVTLAAQLAVCYAHQAQLQALAVGGLLLDRTPAWFPPALGEASLQPFVQALVAPCPPLDFAADQPAYAESLRLTLQRLPVGSFVLLAGDFADIDPEADMPLLQSLAARHSVQAIQILDPVEQRLPATGDFLIEDATAAQPLRIDGRDAQQQDRYAQRFAERQTRLHDCFTACGIPLRICTTQQDLETCLVPTDAAAD